MRRSRLSLSPAYSDYIAEGYDVAALHYLMKPVREDKLFSVLDRAAEKLSRNEKILNFEVGARWSGSRPIKSSTPMFQATM